MKTRTNEIGRPFFERIFNKKHSSEESIMAIVTACKHSIPAKPQRDTSLSIRPRRRMVGPHCTFEHRRETQLIMLRPDSYPKQHSLSS